MTIEASKPSVDTRHDVKILSDTEKEPLKVKKTTNDQNIQQETEIQKKVEKILLTQHLLQKGQTVQVKYNKDLEINDDSHPYSINILNKENEIIVSISYKDIEKEIDKLKKNKISLILNRWGVYTDDNSIEINTVEHNKGIFKKTIVSKQEITLLNESGDELKKYDYERLVKDDAQKLLLLEKKRKEKIDRITYVFARNHGKHWSDEYTLKLSEPTSDDVTLIRINNKQEYTTAEFLKKQDSENSLSSNSNMINYFSTKKKQIRNLQEYSKNNREDILSEQDVLDSTLEKLSKHHEVFSKLQKTYRSNTDGFKAFINHETGFGRSISFAYENRAKSLSAKKELLKHKKASRESKNKWVGSTLGFKDRVVFNIAKKTSFVSAATKATLGIVAHDWNPLKPILGKTVRKAWAANFGKLINMPGLSFEELAARLEEKLMKDSITGEGVRSGKITEQQLRNASVAGIEWAVKMNLIPQLLVNLPILDFLNLNPSEIWSLYRSSNMIKGSPNSIKKFKEALNHAESKKEKILMAATAVISAPAFLLAEKMSPVLAGVNPVLMADIALMRLVGQVNQYMKTERLDGSKALRTLEAVETGITAAFTVDSAVGVGNRLWDYQNFGELDPLSKLKTETEVLDFIEKYPEYSAGTNGGGIFGDWQRTEHKLISTLTGGEESSGRHIFITDESGAPATMSINHTKDGIQIIKHVEDRIFVYGKDDWIWVNNPITEKIADISQETFAPEDETNPPDLEIISQELAQLPELEDQPSKIDIIIDDLYDDADNNGIHDWAIFDKDSNQFAFRVDLKINTNATDYDPDTGEVVYETVDDKVSRLFWQSYEKFEINTDGIIQPKTTIDDSSTNISGSELRNMDEANPLLDQISGDDDVYESQFAREVIDRLVREAVTDNQLKDIDWNEVENKFSNFLQKGQWVTNSTIEGEVDFASLYKYVFEGYESKDLQESHSVDAYDSYQEYFVYGNVKPIVVNIEAGTTINEFLRDNDYPYAINDSGVYEYNETRTTTELVADAIIYRFDASSYARFESEGDGEWSNEFKVLASDAGNNRVGDIVVIKTAETSQLEPLPEVKHLENELGSFEEIKNIAQEIATNADSEDADIITTEPNNQIIVKEIDYNENPKKIVRQPDNEIYLGKIGTQTGTTFGSFINNQLDGVLTDEDNNPIVGSAWNSFYKAFENKGLNGFEVYTVDENGDRLRTFDTIESLDQIFLDERIVIRDNERVLHGMDVQIWEPLNNSGVAPEIIKSSEMIEIQQDIEKYISSLDDDVSVSVSVVDSDSGEGMTVNEDIKYFPATLIKLPIAVLFLQELQAGNLNLYDKSSTAVRAEGYVPTIDQLLRNMIVNSDTVAQYDLVRELATIYNIPETEISAWMTGRLSNDFGMANVVYRTEVMNVPLPEDEGGTVTDFINLQTRIDNGDFFGIEYQKLLQSLMSQAGDNEYTVVGDDLQIYSANIEEKIGIGVPDNSGLNELHSIVKVSTSSGKDYTMAIMTKGPSGDLEDVIRNISRGIFEDINPNLANEVDEFNADKSYQIERSNTARLDVVARLLWNDFNGTEYSPEILAAIPEAVQMDLGSWEPHVQAYTDGSMEVTLKNSSGTDEVILSLNNRQEIVRVINSIELMSQGVTLIDARDLSYRTDQFTGDDYISSDDRSEVIISNINATDIDFDTQNFSLSALQNSTIYTNYDYLIVPGSEETADRIIYLRSVESRDSGAIQAQVKVGVIVNESILNDQSQNVVSLLLNNLGSKEPLSDIVWNWNGTEVKSSEINAFNQTAWYSEIVKDLRANGALDNGATTLVNVDDSNAIEKITQKEYQRWSLRASLLAKTIDRDYEIVSLEQFQKEFENKIISQGIQSEASGYYSINFSDTDWLSLLGLSKSDLSREGALYSRVEYIPEGGKLNLASLAKSLDIPLENLVVDATNVSTEFLVGERIDTENNPETDLSYQYPKNMVLYQVESDNSRERLKGWEAELDDFVLQDPDVDELSISAFWRNKAEFVLGNGSLEYGRDRIKGMEQSGEIQISSSNNSPEFWKSMTREYELKSELPDDPEDIFAVYPLTAPLNSFSKLDLIPLNGEGSTTSNREQYYFEAYRQGRLDDSCGETALYVNFIDGKIFAVELGDDGSLSSVQALVGDGFRYEEWSSTIYGDETMSMRNLISRRLISDLFNRSNKGSFTIEGELLIKFSTNDTKIHQQYEISTSIDGEMLVDDQNRLVYSGIEDNSQFVFSKDTGDFIPLENDKLNPLTDVLSNYSTLTIDGEPVHHNGLPLFVNGSNEMVYVLSSEGLVAVDSIYSKGDFEVVPDSGMHEVANLFGVTGSVEWQKKPSYNSMDSNSNNDKFLYGVSIESDQLLYTSNGLYDPDSDITYELFIKDGSRMVDVKSGKPVITNQSNNLYYVVNENREIEQISLEKMLSSKEFISETHNLNYLMLEDSHGLFTKARQNFAGWRDRQKISIGDTKFDLYNGDPSVIVPDQMAIDRRTQLPVFTDGSLVYGFDGESGLYKLGDLNGLTKTGLIGFLGNFGTFETIVPEKARHILTSDLFSNKEKAGLIIGNLFNRLIEARIKSTGHDVAYESNLKLVTGEKNHISFDEIPPQFLQALVAVENEQTFLQDAGEEKAVNAYALIRAILSGSGSGASTLTHQFLRNALIGHENLMFDATTKSETLSYLFFGKGSPNIDTNRKWWEWMSAASLQDDLSIETIIEGYVNITNYDGRGAAAASQNIFNKNLRDLNLAETALLVVLGNAPSSQGMSSHEQADTWADTATGALRRMNENGFITDEEFSVTRLEIFERLHPFTTADDINYLVEFLDLTSTQEIELNKLADQYNNMSFDDRKSLGLGQYLDFYAYVADQSKVLDKDATSKTVEAYYQSDDNIWNDKLFAWGESNNGQEIANIKSDKNNRSIRVSNGATELDSNQNNSSGYDPNYLQNGVLPGNLLALPRYEGLNFSNDGTNISFPSRTHMYEALTRSNDYAGNSNGTENFVKIGIHDGSAVVKDVNGTLYMVNEDGLEKMSHSILYDTTTKSIIERVPLNVRDSILNVADLSLDKNLLVMDTSGNYYLQTSNDTSPSQVEFYGKTIDIDGQKVLVKLNHNTQSLGGYSINAISPLETVIDTILLSNNSSDLDIDIDKLLLSTHTTSNDPNLGLATVEVNGKEVQLINPTGVETALKTLNIQSTPIEIKNDRELGTQVFKEFIESSLSTNSGLMVWLNYDRYVETKTLDTINDISILEQFSRNEKLISVLDLIEYQGEEYVIYDDPSIAGIQQLEWSQFTSLASSSATSRYKALALDDVETPEAYNQVAFDYLSPVELVSMALKSKENPLSSENIGLTTINEPLQNWMNSQVTNWMSPTATGFYAMITNENGEIISATVYDKENGFESPTGLFKDKFTPGSVFKPVTVLWALANGLDRDKKTKAGDWLEDKYYGSFVMNHTATINPNTGNPERVNNWGAPSALDAAGALASSNNPWMYNIYENREELMTGDVSDPDSLLDYASLIGFGDSHYMPGLDNEGGILPTDEYAIAHPAYQDVLNPVVKGYASFGEHDVTVTIAEMHRLTNAIVNGGTITEPSLIVGEDPIVYGHLPDEQGHLSEDLEEVTEGMFEGANKRGGTSYHVFNDVSDQYTVYGKTGTAELGGDLDPHAWFVGWAVDNVTNEKVVFSFMFENGGEGSGVAAPAVKEMLNEYFKNSYVYQANSKVDPKIAAAIETYRKSHVDVDEAITDYTEGLSIDDTKDATLEQTQASAIEVTQENIERLGNSVNDYMYSPESFFYGLSDRSIWREGSKETSEGSTQPWSYYDPKDNIAAGNNIFDWLNAHVDTSNNELVPIEIEKQFIAKEKTTGIFSQSNGETFNVVTSIGNPDAEKVIVITSHYDTRPEINEGGAAAQGASDNAWTVAMNMELVQLLAKQGVPEGVRVVVAFTNWEEPNYRGLAERNKVAGSRQLMDWLINEEGVNADNIHAINTDGLTNILGATSDVQVIRPRASLVNDVILDKLAEAGFGIEVVEGIDRGNRWGDQLAFQWAGIRNFVRLTDTEESSQDSELDQLPIGGVSVDIKLQTGKLILALNNVIWDEKLRN